ncbi:MAG: hypothetical protein K940chlam7_01270, partial [Chlamydiae bacterium]|nr:hypothetical protein [Chlamydiota bacterium]
SIFWRRFYSYFPGKIPFNLAQCYLAPFTLKHIEIIRFNAPAPAPFFLLKLKAAHAISQEDLDSFDTDQEP